MTIKNYIYNRDFTISWLESHQQSGAFDGFPEEGMNFKKISDNELEYYFDEWIDVERKEDAEIPFITINNEIEGKKMLKKLRPINSVTVIDFETTGLSVEKDNPIEVAVLKVCLESNLVQAYNSMIKLPEGVEISGFITDLTGLTKKEVSQNGKDITDVRTNLKSFLDDETLVIAHNANFDLGFLSHHFNIQPSHFMCTRSIEFLTNPHLSSSLKDVYPRYLREKEQTHRALDDVLMTFEVFEEQSLVHGDAFKFFLNKVIQTPERDLSFIPYNATVLDFAKKYSLKK